MSMSFSNRIYNCLIEQINGVSRRWKEKIKDLHDWELTVKANYLIPLKNEKVRYKKSKIDGTEKYMIIWREEGPPPKMKFRSLCGTRILKNDEPKFMCGHWTGPYP